MVGVFVPVDHVLVLVSQRALDIAPPVIDVDIDNLTLVTVGADQASILVGRGEITANARYARKQNSDVGVVVHARRPLRAEKASISRVDGTLESVSGALKGVQVDGSIVLGVPVSMVCHLAQGRGYCEVVFVRQIR